jgi:hypothetical protein
MKINLAILAITLLWDASPDKIDGYRVKESINGVFVKVSDTPSLQLTLSPKKGNHAYHVVAFRGGMESIPSNTVTIRVKR